MNFDAIFSYFPFVSTVFLINLSFLYNDTTEKGYNEILFNVTNIKKYEIKCFQSSLNWHLPIKKFKFLNNNIKPIFNVE